MIGYLLILLFSLIAGILLGSAITLTLPIITAKYLAVALLAALDSLLGGVNALLNKSFDGAIMLSGFFINALLAAGLAFWGDKIGLDLHLAAVIVFSFRIFNNFGSIRRHCLRYFRQNKKAGRYFYRSLQKKQKGPTNKPLAITDTSSLTEETETNSQLNAPQLPPSIDSFQKEKGE